MLLSELGEKANVKLILEILDWKAGDGTQSVGHRIDSILTYGQNGLEIPKPALCLALAGAWSLVGNNFSKMGDDALKLRDELAVARFSCIFRLQIGS